MMEHLGPDEAPNADQQSVTDEPAGHGHRRLGVWLILGIVVCPVIFSWFTLRRGYSTPVRLGAFLYMLVAVAIAFARVGAERPPAAEAVAQSFLESPQPPAPTPELQAQLDFLMACTAARIRASNITYDDTQDEITEKVYDFQDQCVEEYEARLTQK